jgi:transcriptional regulator with XRE-family HTH domain
MNAIGVTAAAGRVQDAHTALKARQAAAGVAWARTRLGLSLAEVGAAVGASARTVARWAEGAVAPSPAHRQRLEELGETRHLLETVFSDWPTALEWAHTPSAALRGRTPVGEITRGRIADVIEVLAALESGAYT